MSNIKWDAVFSIKTNQDSRVRHLLKLENMHNGTTVQGLTITKRDIDNGGILVLDEIHRKDSITNVDVIVYPNQPQYKSLLHIVR